MASKMSAALDVNNSAVTIGMAEQQHYDNLHCEFCDATIRFVHAFTRQVGEDVVAVEPYFGLNKGQRHTETCRYNVLGQISIIARESEQDVIAAIEGNRYELRLLAVKRAIEKLQELAKKKKNPDSTIVGTTEKIYVEDEKRLGAYINSAKRVLKVRAVCLTHPEIEDVLQLVFDGVRLPWCDFYFEDTDYFGCFSKVSQSTIQVPISIKGIVRKNHLIKVHGEQFAVLDLVSPYRNTDRTDVKDVACFSVWSPDCDAFKAYKEGKELLAFGLWKSHGINERANKKPNALTKIFRNHELRLWPVTNSQLCVIK